jgi:hypothetical protein
VSGGWTAGRQWAAAAVLAAGLAAGGCATAPLPAEPGRVMLPRWFSAPAGEEQVQTPVAIGMQLPGHLAELGRGYPLPAWVVYGAVRALGAEAFMVNGTYRRFSITDASGEDTVVVDDLHYDVPRAGIRAALDRLSAEVAAGETERARLDALGLHVRRRWGAFLLFDLDARGGGPGWENPLLGSGVTQDDLEAFVAGESPAELARIGLAETDAWYENVYVADFRYADPLGSFRKAEEDAIHDLARSLMVRFSHLRRQYTGEQEVASTQEDAVRESMTLGMRGVRVVRRAVDVSRGACVVVVRVPRSGVSRR